VPGQRLSPPHRQGVAALRRRVVPGQPVFVFFGYTHCADVCPATIGTVGLALDADRGKAKAVFVSVDPERDTPAWLTEYARLPPGSLR
jgi:protein SCO1/2